MKEENINFYVSENNAQVLVYELTENVDDLFHKLHLTQAELEKFETIVAEKRKLEFLGVRLCFQKLFGKSVEIINDANGKPYLVDESFEISISHSKNWMAVIAHPEKKVGIDIESRTNKIRKVSKRFLSETEQKELSDCENDAQLELAWSSKEALYKIIGNSAVDFSNHLRIFPFEVKEHGHIEAEHLETGRKFQLSYIQNDDFSLVYCIY